MPTISVGLPRDTADDECIVSTVRPYGIPTITARTLIVRVRTTHLATDSMIALLRSGLMSTVRWYNVNMTE